MLRGSTRHPGRRRPVAAGAVLAFAAGSLVALGPAAVAAGPDYTVLAGTTISLCGVHNFGTLTIQATATLRVADAVSAVQTTPTGANCPSAGDVNELRITADRIVNHGRIDADASQADPFIPDPPSCAGSSQYAPATGNSGGPHRRPGGAGSSGAGGSGYDNCFAVPPGQLFPTLNQGAPGAGSGSGGRGGGLLALVARDVFVNDGEISADGEDGTDSTVGACAFDQTTPEGVIHHPNTGVAAPRGGGAGGSIAIASRSIDFRGTTPAEFHANGGAGGDSRKGASGGGAGGMVWLTGPRVDNAAIPAIFRGSPGTNLCAGDGESAGAEPGSGGDVSYLSQATPTMATQASAGGLLGTSVRDVATVAAGLSPTGTVTFRLFSDPGCTVQVFTSTATLAGGTATSEPATPATAGIYYWTATYNGDAANKPVTSPCGAPGESVIAPFQAPAPTQTITGDFGGPVTVAAGQSVAISNARVLGPVTVNPGGSLTIVNSQVSRGITANAPLFLSLCGAQVSGSPPGAALTVTNAPVPIRIGDPATGCAGNRLAGQVALTGNLAVTFGANTVSHNTTIDNNGPGGSVVTANTVFGTLGCAGNNPSPTNAGQPNTAASKTGQCAGL